jgi:glycosyltransferase involved in cell wall biosynthesis
VWYQSWFEATAARASLSLSWFVVWASTGGWGSFQLSGHALIRPMPASTNATPLVSVVVPTFNRRERLAALLDSLRRQTLAPARIELIVVDDASTDGTAEMLEGGAGDHEFSSFEIVRRTSSGGPAAARNVGWRQARAPLVAFIDDDCEASPAWLEQLVAMAGEDEVALQGRTEPIPREADEVGPFSRTLSVTQLGPMYPTCNMAYPRALLERLGGFDESYPAPGGEDTDLALRAIELGARIEFAESARVFHAVNQYGPLGKLRWALHWSNSVQVFARHPGLRRALTWRIFWKGTHARFFLALLGVALARRLPVAALLCLPYLRELRGRCLTDNYSVGWAPYLALYDATEVLAMARGALRNRVLIL